MKARASPEKIFDDAAIAKLAILGKFPASADLVEVRELLQAAAHFYFEDSAEADDNTVWREFAALHRAAAKNDFKKTRSLLEAASPRTVRLIKLRAERRNFPWLSVCSFDQKEGEQLFCEALCALLRYAGRVGKGRTRATGRRSLSFGWGLFAPSPKRHFPRRDAERAFIQRFRVAWHRATGKCAPCRLNKDSPGPFAEVLLECFKKMGAGSVDVVNVLNRAEWPSTGPYDDLSPINE